MTKYVERHAAHTDVAESDRGAFSIMKVCIDIFADETPNISNLKALTVTDILMVKRYAREVYIAVSLLMISNWSIYGKVVDDMGHIYAMGQDKYPVN